MPKEYRKQILAPKTFHVRKLDGTTDKVPVTFTKERIANFVATQRKMAEGENALSIPAPWRHDDSSPLLQKERAAAGSRANAGFWKQFEQAEDGTLWGVLESDLSDRAIALETKADALTAADAQANAKEAAALRETAKQLRLEEEKIGTTVKAVSPLIRDFTDGVGRKWEDAITHVALVTNPIQPGQDNFQELNQPVIAMSEDGLDTIALADTPSTAGPVPMNAKSGDFKDCLKALEVFGCMLPVDTTPENVIERIITAAVAVSGQKEDDEELPPGTVPQGGPSPVALSEGDDMADSKMSKVASNLAKQTYKQRIDTLIENGLSLDYAKKELFPLVEGYALSLDDEGEPIECKLDIKLETLEAMPRNMSGTVLKPVGKKPRNGLQRMALGDDVEEMQLSDLDAEDEDESAQGRKQGEAARNAELARRGIPVA